ncbi:Transmembrane protein 18 [Desmophyllum pertusum]|uniref:Transmembrane protein 18 n=1 Tax=Desmophyllum pertusum TaxID=174260 RepID=A0A9X0CX89_9CNID|nr:Transmembrane protein 18 [Desmophyllum pertusum]
MKESFYQRGDEWISAKQIDSMLDFVKAVDWSEHWLIGLIAFHTATFLCVLSTRKYTNFQVVLFLLLLGLAFASEQFNILGAKYWSTFAREQYFDSSGLFITVVYSGPILLNCFIMTALWLWTAGKMLIVVKKGQLKEQRKKEAEDKKSN